MLIPLAAISQNQGGKSENPAPFPKMQSTGNIEADRINYEKAVKEWNEAERMRVQKLQQDASKSNISSKRIEKEKSKPVHQASANEKVAAGKAREITILDLPGYPKYIVTGDPVQDEKNYQIAKSKWMSENQETYEKYVKEHSAKSSQSGNLKNRKKVERSN
ncbi:MAG: hypothetical protein KDC13_09320 [Bacteroidetes bacterium]|nr:hypothetical protein [Bacteroidota bacterium]